MATIEINKGQCMDFLSDAGFAHLGEMCLLLWLLNSVPVVGWSSRRMLV